MQSILVFKTDNSADLQKKQNYLNQRLVPLIPSWANFELYPKEDDLRVAITWKTKEDYELFVAGQSYRDFVTQAELDQMGKLHLVLVEGDNNLVVR